MEEEQLSLSLLTEFSTTTLCHIGLESENLFCSIPLPTSTLCFDPANNTERLTQLCTSPAIVDSVVHFTIRINILQHAIWLNVHLFNRRFFL